MESFVKLTEGKVSKFNKIQLQWEPYTSLDLQIGEISSMRCRLGLIYGSEEGRICWRSKSGVIYKLEDEIDCDDFICWFDELDIDACLNRINPKWSLMTFQKGSSDSPIIFSTSFISCMDNQLSMDFKKVTGLRLNGNIWLYPFEDELKMEYLAGQISSMRFNLGINGYHNTVKVLWKSRSGIVIAPYDEVDCQDMHFFFENLEISTYHQQYYGNRPLTLNFGKLNFEVVVVRLQNDAVIESFFHDSGVDNIQDIFEKATQFLHTYEMKSADNPEKVLSNWIFEFKDDGMVLNADLTNCGMDFLKKYLKFLSSLKAFRQVIIQ